MKRPTCMCSTCVCVCVCALYGPSDHLSFHSGRMGSLYCLKGNTHRHAHTCTCVGVIISRQYRGTGGQRQERVCCPEGQSARTHTHTHQHDLIPDVMTQAELFYLFHLLHWMKFNRFLPNIPSIFESCVIRTLE